MEELKEKINNLIGCAYLDEDTKKAEKDLVDFINQHKLAWLKEVAPKQNELNYDLSSPFDAHWHNGSCAYEKQLFQNAEKSLKGEK